MFCVGKATKERSIMKKESNKKLSIWAYIIPPALLATLTALFYSRSLTYEFQFDSVANISKQFSIRYNGFKELFFNSTRWISYWLNTVYYGINKFNPFAYRVGNVLIHITTGLLVFFILLFALKNLKQKNFFSRNALPLAFFTAILFLLHPVQTQTVSYVIQGQLEGLAALFILSIVLCFYFVTRAQKTVSKILLTGLLFILGLFSCGTKEIAIISPALLFVFDWFFIAQGDWKQIKKRIWLYLTYSLFIFGIYLYFLKPQFFTSILGFKKIAKNNIGNVITHKAGDKITPWVFFISQFKVLVHYLVMFVWPFNISVEYDWVLSRGLFYPDSLFPLLALLSLAAVVISILKKNKTSLIAFGFVWFFICLAPRSSIIPSPELLVDYKTYLASFGWLFLIASAFVWSAQTLLNKFKKMPTALSTKRYGVELFGLLLAVCLGTMTMQRNTVWRSGLEFWGNVLKNAPGKARAYNNYGVELSQKQKDYEGAVPYFRKAIAMDKNYPDPLNNIAVAYSHLGKVDEAIAALKKSLKIHKYYPEGYNNLASFFIIKKKYDQAEKCLELALKLRPHYGKAFFNKGRIYLQKKQKEKAWECFRDACTKADFDIQFGFKIFGQISMELKKYDSALFAYKKMLQFDPNNVTALFNIANAYFLTKQFEKSKQTYKQILVRKPDDLKAIYNLAEAYFNLDDLKPALQHYQKVYHMRQFLPYIQIRMATCLERLGRPYEAKNLVEQFLQEHPEGGGNIKNGNPLVIAQLRKNAETILGNMNKRYPGRVIIKNS